MVCSFCQENIDDRSAVCIHCGMRVDRTISVKPVAATVKPDKPAAPIPQQTKEIPKPVIPEPPAPEPEMPVEIPEEPAQELPAAETILPPPEPAIDDPEPEIAIKEPEIPVPKPVPEMKFDREAIVSRRSTPRSAPVDIQPVKKSKAAAVIGGIVIAILIGLIVLLLSGIGLLVALEFLTETEKDFAPTNPSYADDMANAVPEDEKEYLFFSEDGAYCYHIPVVRLNGVDAGVINEDLYNTHYAHLQEMVFGEEYPFMLGMTYSVQQKGDIVSVMVQEFCDTDLTTYYVYNFSATTGEEVSDGAVFAAFGLTESEGRNHMRESLSMYWDKRNQENGDEYWSDFVKEIIEKTLSDKNIQSCRPFIDKDSNLRYTGSIYSLGGAECYDWIFDDEGNAWREQCSQHT